MSKKIEVGYANIDIDKVVAGSTAHFTITVTIGDYGLDNTGEIIIARRDVCDADLPQFTHPHKPGYVKVMSDTVEKYVKLSVEYVTWRYIRPWKACISIKVSDGSLHKGDRIFISYGAKNGMGYRMQTYAEKRHVFLTMLDCAGSGNFFEVEKSPVIAIHGGYPAYYEAVIPSILQKNESFDCFVRAMDGYGNLSEPCSDVVTIKVAEQTKKLRLQQGIGQIHFDGAASCGVLHATVENEERSIRGGSNPGLVQEQKNEHTLYFGDMHGQTWETVGTGTPKEYFAFAKDVARMDFCAWQGNDFQVTDDLYEEVRRQVRAYQKDGTFVTFLGYEWSATTPNGGDHNVYFKNDDGPIHRSYRWQMGLCDKEQTDRITIEQLCDTYKGRDDVMLIPHVGGRYGDVSRLDRSLMPLIEIHSHHGTFEWMLSDALAEGHKVGVWAASDDHTGRPGLSMPTKTTSRGGFVSFDVMGGYGGVYARKLDRASIWEAMSQRRCFATTGVRMLPQITCNNKMPGEIFRANGMLEFDVDVIGTHTLEDVQLWRNMERLVDLRQGGKKIPRRVRMLWSGVRIRSRQKKACWDGLLTVTDGRFGKVEGYAFKQPEEGAFRVSDQRVQIRSCTSGDSVWIEFDVEQGEDPIISYSCDFGTFQAKYSAIEKEGAFFDVGGVNLQLVFEPAVQSQGRRFTKKWRIEKREGVCDAYYLRVLQKDGHMAWTSPFYIS